MARRSTQVSLGVMKAVYLVLAVLLIGCSAHARRDLPELRPSDLELRISTMQSQIDGVTPMAIDYELANRSSVAVCTGMERLLVGEKEVQAVIINDALCSLRGFVVPANESRRWTDTWLGSRCLGDAPQGFAAALPNLMCGAKVLVRAEIFVFRVVGGIEQFGGTLAVSNPMEVTLVQAASGMPATTSFQRTSGLRFAHP